jgi:uncharacterized protein YjiS (DUF1127 family)
MSNKKGVGANRSLTAFLGGPVRLVYERVIQPMRRHARWRGGEREFALLDDRLLRDIGLTRSQVLAAGYGPLRPASVPLRMPSAPPDREMATCA